jgi:hypothetical protein
VYVPPLLVVKELTMLLAEGLVSLVAPLELACLPLLLSFMLLL